MEIFLVTIEYQVSHYMGGNASYTKTHLVHAETEDEAMEKTSAFYESKTCEYDVYYSVYNVSVNETIK